MREKEKGSSRENEWSREYQRYKRLERALYCENERDKKGMKERDTEKKDNCWIKRVREERKNRRKCFWAV